MWKKLFYWFMTLSMMYFTVWFTYQAYEHKLKQVTGYQTPTCPVPVDRKQWPLPYVFGMYKVTI